MFIINWWRYCRGYLVISLAGSGVERLLNMAIARGIGFWDLRKQPAGARLSISLHSFKALRPLVRQAHCRLHILRKVGLPFWSYRLRRRWGLVLGIIFFCLSLYIATSLVWFVRVTGTGELTEAEVRAMAAELGLRPGVWKRNLDLSELEEELARRHGEIAWAGIRVRGTVLEIEIVEHLPEPGLDNRPADLVAAKDGLILRILALEGTAAVAPGDTVAKGDLLIAGMVSAPETAPSGEEELPVQEVRARGVVEARVWYEGTTPVIKEEVIEHETGRSVRGCFLQWPRHNKRLRLWGTVENPYAHAREQVTKTSWRWRNLSLPVEVVTVTYHELTLERRALSPEQALEKARFAALKLTRAQIPEEAVVERVYYQEYTDEGRERVRAVVETRENIAAIRLRQP